MSHIQTPYIQTSSFQRSCSWVRGCHCKNYRFRFPVLEGIPVLCSLLVFVPNHAVLISPATLLAPPFLHPEDGADLCSCVVTTLPLDLRPRFQKSGASGSPLCDHREVPQCLYCLIYDGRGVGKQSFLMWASLGGSDGKESACNAGEPASGSVPASGRRPGEGNGNPLRVLFPGKFHFYPIKGV